MKLGHTVSRQLQKFLLTENEKNLSSEIDKYVFDDDFDKIHLHVEIKDFDKFSFHIGKLELKNIAESKEIKLTAENLKEQAKRLVGKVTYLLENLALIEFDSVNLVAQIRSVSPYKEIDLLSYYEIVIDNQGRISVERFQQNKEEPRVQIPFKLTEEVFERLIDDLAESVS
jgi:hypothetical protein